MSLSDILFQGLSTTVIGMAIVFVTLAAIAAIISLLRYLGEEKKAKKPEPTQAAPTPAPEPKPVEVAPIEPKGDDPAIIAAITAAIAASLNASSDNLRVVSFRRANAWANAARREQHTKNF